MTTLLCLLLATAPDAALMERLAAHDARLQAQQQNSSWVMALKAEELDSDGKPESVTEVVNRVTVKDGQSSEELIKAVEDGKDITEKTKAEKNGEAAGSEKGEKGGKGGKMEVKVSTGGDLPFARESQGKYEFALLPPSAAAPDLVRIGFKPRGEKSASLMMGDAVVDPVKGEVVRVSMRLSKNPTFIDHLTMEIEMDAQTPAGRAMSRMDLRGDGGLLFIRKRFHVETRFSDYK